MKIELKKFDTILSSRPDGREAWLAFQPLLSQVRSEESIEVDFDGVQVFNPSWGDEFLTPLCKKFGDRITFLNTENASVQLTLETLEKTSGLLCRKK